MKKFTCNAVSLTSMTTVAMDTIHKARIGANYFLTLPAAYSSSVSTVIRAWGTDFADIITCDKVKNVTLDGGYNDAYSAKSGFTNLQQSGRAPER